MSRATGRPSDSPRDALTRVGCVLVVGGFVTVALLGAVVSAPMTIFVVGPASGALVPGLFRLTADGPPRHRSALRVLLAAAGTGLLLIPFLAGVVLLGALGVVIALVVPVLGARGGTAPQLRAVLLEEPAHRHPRAVDHWLTQGGSENPERHIEDDRVK